MQAKVNFYVDREQFQKLEQGEDEKINDFKARVRAKAQNCDFRRGCKTMKCPTCCAANQEEDEIRTIIV